jgi:hypothetical protein
MDRDEQRETAETAAAPRSGRRLADRILTAVHTACDQGELEVAEQLLRVMATLVAGRTHAAESNRRRLMDAVVAAHERLWHLRHPDAGDP